MRQLFAAGKGIKKGKASIRVELTELIRQERHHLCPLLILLAAWLNQYLENNSQTSPATPRRYLSSIGNVLLATLGEDDILEMEAGDFIESYDRAIEAIESKKEKGYASAAIGRFHDFLVRYYGVPRLHEGLFKRRYGPPETSV